MKEKERKEGKGGRKSRFGVDRQGNGTEFKKDPKVVDKKNQKEGKKVRAIKRKMENVGYNIWI